jgi:hypothetical protein
LCKKRGVNVIKLCEGIRAGEEWKEIKNLWNLSENLFQTFAFYRKLSNFIVVRRGLLLGSMRERGKRTYNKMVKENEREREKFPLSKLNKSSFLINFLCVSLSLYAQRINFEMAIKFIINSNAMAIKISFCIAINADYFVSNFPI